MNRFPNVWRLSRLVDYANKGECLAGLPDGRWVPARPLGFASLGQRFKAGWLVFSGQADALKWDGQ